MLLSVTRRKRERPWRASGIFEENSHKRGKKGTLCFPCTLGREAILPLSQRPKRKGSLNPSE